ncbi:isoprenylcysteine carboxylmethyltransferase family protein [Actinoplanes bogorensis]|uniref:Isoprenylcysteine carboxylmethyltransferase family protein n=1 Tax=Paractinoplanes bogorensis TaxID=1610840 RepID=A0ABS5Z4I3_9ACTN|nr:NnrU family protein [Actinoplanes bogorensis]MBU2669873.1 isoprenylcysteine carboxylmethyltransferase family protein [Actinoplanes bogorensis]
MMSRAYALFSYALFLISIVWAIGFLAGWGDGPASSSPTTALLIDGTLLLAFAVQHTVMARAGFKRRIPPTIERSTYVLAASLLLLATFAFWQPVPTVVWLAGAPWSILIWVVYALGWALAIGATYMIDHFEFFGLKPAGNPQFQMRFLYAWIRHPMMLGLLIVFWATPRMTVSHLFFAVASSAYIFVGVRFEERDLKAQLGTPYEEYARDTPMLIPLGSRGRAARAGRP